MIAGTQILMADGSTKNVQDVQVGDFLLGYIEFTPTFSPFVKVVKSKVNSWTEYYVINNRLNITYEYPVLVKRKMINDRPTERNGLFLVEKLEIGDSMVKYDGTLETVVSISTVSGSIPIYNFATDGNNLFIAEDLVIHNPTVEKF